MYIDRKVKVGAVFEFTKRFTFYLIIWSIVMTFVHEYSSLPFLNIPFMPISLVGTVVAFYLGFKNNSAYERMWEARKIWGSIVNESRAWGVNVRSYLNSKKEVPENNRAAQKELIYRHIFWIYSLRSELMKRANWEHGGTNKHEEHREQIKKYETGFGLDRSIVVNYLKELNLSNIELPQISPTQILDIQSQKLKDLNQIGLVNDLKHIELQRNLTNLLASQGMCERIKKFPLPRQYAYMSSVFVKLFIFLFPFSIIHEFEKIGEYGVWLFIPINVFIGWMYYTMEIIGDYSENPFEGLAMDIPMLSICTAIEIDLLKMIGDVDIPNPIQPTNGVLI